MGRLPKRAGGGSYYILVPLAREAREMKLPPVLSVDKHFFSWKKTIPMIRK
jgi:hypothetical protein